MLMFIFSHQWTPLHQAAVKGNIDVVRYLCDMGADLNPKNVDGVSK